MCLCGQPGLREIQGRWFTPQTAGGSSVGSRAHHWSKWKSTLHSRISVQIDTVSNQTFTEYRSSDYRGPSTVKSVADMQSSGVNGLLGEKIWKHKGKISVVGGAVELLWLSVSQEMFSVVFCVFRKKPLLFYFNILKCASPLVLLEFQCPTTQVFTPSLPL